MKKHIAFVVVLALFLCSQVRCTEGNSATDDTPDIDSSSVVKPEVPDTTTKDSDSIVNPADSDSVVTPPDTTSTATDESEGDDYLEHSTFDKTVKIVFNGTNATITNSNQSIICTQSGAHVTVNAATNSVSGVEIILSGSTTNGGLKIYGNKRLKITLDGATITSTTGAAINNQCKKRTFVYLTPGTTSTLTDASSYTDLVSGEDSKACLFSESQLIFSGTGTLNVSSKSLHAIASDEYVRVMEGTINVTAAAKDGIHANDFVRTDGGSTTVTATADGIQCEEGYILLNAGTVKVTSGDDGIVTSYDGTSTAITPYIYVMGANVTVNTSGTKGMGLKAEGRIEMSEGQLTVKTTGTAAKCLKSTGNIILAGGTIDLTTTGGGMYDSEDQDVSAAACIASDSTVTVGGANITTNSSGLGGKGIKCTDFVLNSGTVNVTTTGTPYTYSSYSSSPKGIRAANTITINGGTLNVNATGKKDGSEGIEAKNSITVNGGETYVYAYDDAINATKKITVTGGKIYAYAINNDAIDSNGTFSFTGGIAIAAGTTVPEDGFDCDQNEFSIKGGILIGIGGGTSAPTSSASTQASITTSGFAATQGQYLSVQSSDGTQLCNFKLPRTLSGCVLLFSSPKLTTGTTYYIKTGGSISGTTSDMWNGYYPSATYSGGSQAASATAALGGTSSGGGPGGGPGGPGGRP